MNNKEIENKEEINELYNKIDEYEKNLHLQVLNDGMTNLIDEIQMRGNEIVNSSELIDKLDKRIEELEKDSSSNIKNSISKEKELEEYIMDKFKDKSIAIRINDYFQNAFSNKDVAKVFVDDIAKDDCVLSDFIEFLKKKNFDYNYLTIRGYTAKQIYMENPRLSPSMIFWFFGQLKSNPEWAKKAIKEKFPNKDYVIQLLEKYEVPIYKNKYLYDIRAKKYDWNITEMPSDNIQFMVNKKLTNNDIDRLKLGHIPKMDHWFSYAEDNDLYIYSSLTGVCMYIVELNTTGQLNIIANKELNNSDIEKDKQAILCFLNDKNGQTILNNYEQKELAARLLKLEIEEIESNSGMIDDKLLYVSIAVKGGDSLIVDEKGEILYASSSIDFDEHLEEFKKGRRTPIESFWNI